MVLCLPTRFHHPPCHQHMWLHPAQSSHEGHILDYVIVNHTFRSSLLDCRLYHKTHLQSDHRQLMVAKMKLTLKAKRRLGQRLLNYQLNPFEGRTDIYLQKSSWWGTWHWSCERHWVSLVHLQVVPPQSSRLPPYCCLDRGDGLVTDKVCEMSRRKQEVWMRWTESPDNCEIMD